MSCARHCFLCRVYIGVNKTNEKLGHEPKQSFHSPVSKHEMEQMQVDVRKKTPDGKITTVEKNRTT
ncbi:hypothetical protein ACI2OX_09305 [Bacillus sp. N9]